MRVRCDNEVDAAYIQLSTIEPKGVIEIKERGRCSCFGW